MSITRGQSIDRKTVSKLTCFFHGHWIDLAMHVHALTRYSTCACMGVKECSKINTIRAYIIHVHDDDNVCHVGE